MDERDDGVALGGDRALKKVPPGFFERNKKGEKTEPQAAKKRRHGDGEDGAAEELIVRVARMVNQMPKTNWIWRIRRTRRILPRVGRRR